MEGTFREALLRAMEEESLLEPMAAALARKAAEGDLRAMSMVLGVLGEDKEFDPVYRIEFGEGVEACCK